jgi:hypothetical protein
MSGSDDWRENVNAKVLAQAAARARATAIVSVSEDLTRAVNAEVARCTVEELGKVLDEIDIAKRQLVDGKESTIDRPRIVHWLDRLAGRLTVIRAGYRVGSLPKPTEAPK